MSTSAVTIPCEPVVPVATKSAVTVSVLRTREEIDRFEGHWRAWQYHPNADPDFYWTIVKARSEVLYPFVLLASRSGEASAMLIGRLERIPHDIRFGYLHFGPEVRSLTFIQGGYLGEITAEVARAFRQTVSENLREGCADLVFFSHGPKGPLFEGIHTTSNTERVVELPPSYDGFLAQLSPKARKNQQWQARRIEKEFCCEIRCLSQSDELDTLFSEVESIAKSTYQRGLGVGFADTPEMRNRLALAAGQGWLRAYVLYLNESPAAFWIGTLYQGTFFSDFMGYDSTHARHSPGMYLVWTVIARFFHENVTAVDFGLGDAQYKEVLGNRMFSTESAYFYAPTLKGMALKRLRLAAHFVDKSARETLSLFRLQNRAKKLWRKCMSRA